MFEAIGIVLSIIFIDIILAGDNAVVIGMATRRLLPALRRKAALWGVGGAVGLRVLFTTIVTVLLRIPLLRAAGGALLVWIAFKLLVQEEHSEVGEAYGFWEAVRTIVVADAAMSLDNVIAIAGAAHGHIGLVVFGLLVSVPIVVWGSQVIAGMMQRHPWIVYAGGAILAWVAGGMLAEDQILHHWLGAVAEAMPYALVVLVPLLGWWAKQRRLPEPGAGGVARGD